MGAAEIGFIIGSFFISLLFAAVWLIFCMLVPGLRRNPNVSYGVAIALAILPVFITAAGINIYNVTGTGLCVLLLAWQMRRAKARLSLEART